MMKPIFIPTEMCSDRVRDFEYLRRVYSLSVHIEGGRTSGSASGPEITLN